MNMWKLVAAALSGAAAVRHRRNGVKTPETKFIGEVPILNYHLAYQNSEPSLVEGEGLKQEWILVLKKAVTNKLIEKFCSSTGKCMRKGHPCQGGMPYFQVSATEEELAAVVKKIGKQYMKYVEPDAQVYAIPEMEGAANAASWGLDRIGASDRANEGEGTHVYVLDTGIRASHSDFGGRVVPALDLTTGSLVECDGDVNCAGDAQGHGTHCAGTAAGASYGVAPKAAVRTVKVLSDQGSGSWSWSFDALDWLATKGERPAVASMSLGGSGTQAAMKDAVDVAVNAGVVVVVAGGNDNSNACGFSPAFVPSAITVGSTTSDDARSSFSNYGECTDIWAPGSDIVSAAHNSDDGKRSLSGTSMACPHVSGASALLLEADPSLTAAQVIDGLLENAVTNAISGLKNGDVNKLLYVGAGGPPPTPVPAPTPPPPPANCPSFCSDSICWYSGCKDCAVCGGLVQEASKDGKGRKKGKGGKKSKGRKKGKGGKKSKAADC